MPGARASAVVALSLLLSALGDDALVDLPAVADDECLGGVRSGAECALHALQRRGLKMTATEGEELQSKTAETDVGEEEVQTEAPDWLQCVNHTGGTCNLFGCHNDRGPTKCEGWWGAKQCSCIPGYCSDLAGKCVRERNQLIARRITFRNVQWPDYKLHMDWSGITVDNKASAHDPAYKWNLYRVGSYGKNSNSFMLGSVKYPEFIATLKRHENCGTNQTYNCPTTWTAESRRVNKMTMSHVIKLYKVDWREPAVAFAAAEHPDMFWHVAHASWGVTGRRGDPGPQGYWTPHPPLPRSIHLPRMMS